MKKRGCEDVYKLNRKLEVSTSYMTQNDLFGKCIEYIHGEYYL